MSLYHPANHYHPENHPEKHSLKAWHKDDLKWLKSRQVPSQLDNGVRKAVHFENDWRMKRHHIYLSPPILKGLCASICLISLRYLLQTSAQFDTVKTAGQFLPTTLYEGGVTPIPSCTAFIAGSLFLLSLLSKGVLEEYGEVYKGALQIRMAMTGFESLCQSINAQVVLESRIVLLRLACALISDGGVYNSNLRGKKRVNDALQELNTLSLRILKLTQKEGEGIGQCWTAGTGIYLRLQQQHNTIQNTYYRMLDVEEHEFLRLRGPLLHIVAFCNFYVLCTVDTAHVITEYVLLPCMVLIIYLLVFFIDELENPCNTNQGCVVVSLESLHEFLSNKGRAWFAPTSALLGGGSSKSSGV